LSGVFSKSICGLADTRRDRAESREQHGNIGSTRGYNSTISKILKIQSKDKAGAVALQFHVTEPMSHEKVPLSEQSDDIFGKVEPSTMVRLENRECIRGTSDKKWVSPLAAVNGAPSLLARCFCSFTACAHLQLCSAGSRSCRCGGIYGAVGSRGSVE